MHKAQVSDNDGLYTPIAYYLLDRGIQGLKTYSVEC